MAVEDIDVYGAGLDDVDHLVIWDVRESEDPPPAEIEQLLIEGASLLQGTIGTLDENSPCGGDGFRARARRVVALYAASFAEDAHYPERTQDREAGDHGSRMWNRWERLNTALIADVEKCRDGINASGATGGSAHSFPRPPFFAREQGT